MKTTRKLVLTLAIVALAALFVPTAAFANFAIHGNYVNDTDACAGCHRAHTSVSSITWQDAAVPANNHSGLLVSSATSMYEFCYACHDTQGYSADTDVRDGVYYGTANGKTGAILNGGGFESFDGVAVTSKHVYSGTSWGAYGGGYAGAGKVGADGQIVGENQGESNQIKMDCATCHDPHGSSNYRILKAYVNGNYVGGYQPSADPQNPTPDGFVSSVETGWPDQGFKLHKPYPAYQPNYTTPMYAKGYDRLASGAAGAVNPAKGMSGWCSGCHSTYLGDSTQVFTKADGTQYQSLASTYNAGDGAGLALRHKHPINVPLSAYNAADKASMITTDALVLPLANDLSEKGTPKKSDSDWIECLTCHRAHGTAAVMKGEAAKSTVLPFVSATPSALLRLDNRGVCEACHNK